MKTFKFIVSGGGTGGHIYPAIAIADEIKKRFQNADILFVGASDKMEMQKVPQAGYPIRGLWIAGLQRKITLRNLLFPIKLLFSLAKSVVILLSFKPDVVIGTGGFASGPLLQMASFLGIPTLIQEQNSYPGITNKILGKKVDRICVAYENMERFFSPSKLVLTGNPIRGDLFDVAFKKAEALHYFALKSSQATVLVMGGSLGAKKINELVEMHIQGGTFKNVQLIWQCGKLYYDKYKNYNSSAIRVHAFLEKMDLAYAAADVIVSRAGASSVSELCVVGKAVIFIPSPNVAEDHQTKNAAAIGKQNAAVVLSEMELNQRFEAELLSLLTDEDKRIRLGVAIKSLAKDNAAFDIVNEVQNLLPV